MIKTKEHTHFIGIDVSRDKLDCAIAFGKKLLLHKVIPNTVSDISNFVKEVKTMEGLKLPKTVFGFEQTGIYTTHLLTVLKKARVNIVMEDAVHIKNSLGKIRGKYDKLDAIRIATYLYKAKGEVKLWEGKRPIVNELAHLSTLRTRLITLYNAMRVPMREQKDFLDPSLVEKHAELSFDSLTSLKGDVAKVEMFIQDTIRSDERIKRLYDIITSVPFVGPMTAIQVIVATNEYKDIVDPKKFASYAGVAPFRDESGSIQRKPRVSPMSSRKTKALLHICAVGSIKGDTEFRAYYLKKTVDEGKPKMAVLNAIRYKIILRIFACLKQDRLYQKDYVRETTTNV